MDVKIYNSNFFLLWIYYESIHNCYSFLEVIGQPVRLLCWNESSYFS